MFDPMLTGVFALTTFNLGLRLSTQDILITCHQPHIAMVPEFRSSTKGQKTSGLVPSFAKTFYGSSKGGENHNLESKAKNSCC